MDNVDIIVTTFRIAFALILALSLIPVLVFMERKVAAFIQDRPGPNRTNINGVRMAGLVQSLADAVKLIFKEDYISAHIKKRFFFKLAPGILFVMSMLTLSVMPFANNLEINGKSYIMQAIPVDIGMLWYLGFAGLSVFGIILAGYASDSKFGLLGSLRASAQTISYEIPMGLAVVSMLITYGSIHLNDFVVAQEGTFWGIFPKWGVLMQPLACIIFIVTAFAETNRTPFDLAEGESEIVAGYHTEYGAMRFALFFMAEYVAMVVASALIITLFFGGYNLPWVSTAMLKEYSFEILFATVCFLPFMAYAFISWINKNNVTRYKTNQDMRTRENKIFTALVAGVTALVELSIIGLLIKGVNSFDASIVTMVIQILIFSAKTIFMLFVFIWVRWTLPRFRYDQLQRLGWEKLIPLSVLNIVVTAIIVVAMGA